MPAPVSIVIPTWQAEDCLPETLAALMEGVAAGLVRELVISDGGSEDATRAIAEDVGARVVTGPRGRGGQLARGAAAARGGWLLFLHADTHLSPGWAGHLRDHIARAPEKAAYFRLRFRSAGWAPALVAGWANLRARGLGLPYGDQGLAIPRGLYEDVGGFPDIPLMEDVAVARALSGRLACLPAFALTSDRRYRERGWIRHGSGNLLRLARYLGGADPARLARAYDGR